MKRAVALVAALTAMALGAACTNTTGVGGVPVTTRPPLPTGENARNFVVQPDPPPEGLVIPPAPNRNAELLQRLSQRAPVCEVIGDALLNPSEPDPHDIDGLIESTTAAYLSTTFLDRSSKVRDEKGRPGRVPAPKDMMRRVNDLKLALFSYNARLTYAKAVRDAGTIDDRTMRRWMDYYFLVLVNSPFTAASEKLIDDHERYC